VQLTYYFSGALNVVLPCVFIVTGAHRYGQEGAPAPRVAKCLRALFAKRSLYDDAVFTVTGSGFQLKMHRSAFGDRDLSRIRQWLNAFSDPFHFKGEKSGKWTTEATYFTCPWKKSHCRRLCLLFSYFCVLIQLTVHFECFKVVSVGM